MGGGNKSYIMSESFFSSLDIIKGVKRKDKMGKGASLKYNKESIRNTQKLPPLKKKGSPKGNSY